MPLIPVERGGRLTWEWQGPDVCPAGHADGTLMCWLPCPDCETRAVCWECRWDGCRAYSVDRDHVCPR